MEIRGAWAIVTLAVASACTVYVPADDQFPLPGAPVVKEQADGSGMDVAMLAETVVQDSAGPVCGDGKCESDESANTCAQDCASAPVCGDGKCESGESANTCAQDCAGAPVCGDGKCDPAETCANCASDCGCSGGQNCSAGSCVAAGSALCSSCSQASDCASGSCAGYEKFPEVGKMCSPAGSCDSDGDCPPSWGCQVNGNICWAKTTFVCKNTTTRAYSDNCGNIFGSLPCAAGQTCSGGQCNAVCGNGICSTGETASNCPADCKTGPTCGNGICESGETASSCAKDCKTGPTCGNGICESGETASSCAKDCKTGPICGNGTCESGETSSNCPGDCGSSDTVDGSSSEVSQNDVSSSDAYAKSDIYYQPQDACDGWCGTGFLNCSSTECLSQLNACVMNSKCQSAAKCMDNCNGNHTCMTACYGQAVPGTSVDLLASLVSCGQQGSCIGYFNPVCGNGVCEPPESAMACPQDCGS